MATRTYADVDGYWLEVPPWWHDLSDDDLAQLCNGVGPDDWPVYRRRMVGRCAGWMVPASRPHDVRYSRISCDCDRLTADRELWRNWRATIRQHLGWRPWHWLIPGRRVRYAAMIGLARLAYRAVRLAGAQYAHGGSHVHDAQ